jgi:hypothetical protein
MTKFPKETPPSLRSKLEQVIAAAKICDRAEFHTPALILLYSVIDAAAALCAEQPQKHIQQYYTAWVDRYLLPSSKLECSAIDVWGARCGVVHTLSNESNFSRRAEARKIIYVNRGGDRSVLEGFERIRTADDLAEARGQAENAETKQSENVIVEVESLVEAVLRGIDSMFLDIDNDPILAQRVREREDKVLRTLSTTQAAALFEWGKAMLAIADAPEIELFDLESPGDCSCNGTALVLVRALNEYGRPIAETEMCTQCAESVGSGTIRDFRKRTPH